MLEGHLSIVLKFVAAALWRPEKLILQVTGRPSYCPIFGGFGEWPHTLLFQEDRASRRKALARCRSQGRRRDQTFQCQTRRPIGCRGCCATADNRSPSRLSSASKHS